MFFAVRLLKMDHQDIWTPSPSVEKNVAILLVDEDATMREMLRMALQIDISHRVFQACSSINALHVVSSLLPDLMIIDYELSGATGLQLYDQMHQGQAFPPIPGLLVSAPFSTSELGPRPLWILQEPFDLQIFLATVKQVVLFASRQRTGVFAKHTGGS